MYHLHQHRIQLTRTHAQPSKFLLWRRSWIFVSVERTIPRYGFGDWIWSFMEGRNHQLQWEFWLYVCWKEHYIHNTMLPEIRTRAIVLDNSPNTCRIKESKGKYNCRWVFAVNNTWLVKDCLWKKNQVRKRITKHKQEKERIEILVQIRYNFVHKKGFQLIFRYVQKTFMAYQKLKFNNLNIIRFLYSFCIT